MHRWLKPLPLLLLLAQVTAAPIFAEEQNTSPTSLVLIPGALGRMESYGPMGYWRLCSPQSIGLMEWRTSFLKRLLEPNNSQLELLHRLEVASAAAKRAITSACVKETVSTGPVHVTEMEKRLNGLLDSIKVLREPYEAFYTSLDNRQKTLLDDLGPRRRGWPW